MKKIDSAIKSYEKAIITSHRKFREAEENIAQDLLLSGKWLEGWKYYETRLERMKNEMAIYYQLFGKPWKGLNDTREMEELIIVCEQGLGDTIQFIRLLKILHSKGIKTRLLCQEALKGILSESTNITEIVTSINSYGSKTLWCPLMSLMHRIEFKQSMIDNTPYIFAEQYRKNYWKKRIKPKKKLLIGLHWQGNKRYEKSVYSHKRSIGAEMMSKIGNIENAEYSTPKGQRSVR